MGGFDPAALQPIKIAESDLGYSWGDTASEISLVADATVRQRCASVKLAAQIVARAYGVSADLGDGQVLAGMSEVLKRLTGIRQACMGFVGIGAEHEDYGTALAMATGVAVDVVTEEFKWRQSGARTKELPLGLLARLMEAVGSKQPKLFPKAAGKLDLAAARKLATLKAVPHMMGLVNLFDYYTIDRDAMVSRLVYAVASQAEYHALQDVEGMSEFGQALMIQQAYGVSVGIMVEVFRASAYKDVLVLRDMQDMDRAIVIANFERVGGMGFEHVLAEHDRVMGKTYDVCKLIVTAQSGNLETEDE